MTLPTPPGTAERTLEPPVTEPLSAAEREELRRLAEAAKKAEDLPFGLTDAAMTNFRIAVTPSRLLRFLAERDRLAEVLAFAASCIKSGERWSATCDEVIGGALRGTARAALSQDQEGAGE